MEEPYQTPDNMSRKKGFVIVVQQLYKWKYLPVAKVLFCDCQRFADMLRNKSERTQMELMESFWSVTWGCDVADRIAADQQVSATSSPVFLSEKKRAWVMSCLQMSFHGRQRLNTLDKYIVLHIVEHHYPLSPLGEYRVFTSTLQRTWFLPMLCIPLFSTPAAWAALS